MCPIAAALGNDVAHVFLCEALKLLQCTSACTCICCMCNQFLMSDSIALPRGSYCYSVQLVKMSWRSIIGKEVILLASSAESNKCSQIEDY